MKRVFGGKGCSIGENRLRKRRGNQGKKEEKKEVKKRPGNREYRLGSLFLTEGGDIKRREDQMSGRAGKNEGCRANSIESSGR